MRAKSILLLILVIFRLINFAPHSRAQDRLPVCDHPEGAYYQPNLFPRFADSNNRLVLADLTTGENTITLAEELPYIYDFVWSPDCHYLIGYANGYGDCYPGLIIWDAVTGERKLSKGGFCDYGADSYPRVFWKPDQSAVLLSEWYRAWNSEGSSGKSIIWYPTSGQEVLLHVTGIQPNLFQVYWDDARRWVWGSSHEGVTAFDTRTGLERLICLALLNRFLPFRLTNPK
jgi:hypothetical protein